MAMKINRYAAGTQKQAVWEKFATAGQAAAVSHAQSLHVHGKSIKAWLKTWQIEYGDGGGAAMSPDELDQAIAVKPDQAKAARQPRNAIEKAEAKERARMNKPPREPKIKTEGDLTAKQVANKKYISQTKKQVQVKHAPDKIAYMVHQGAEQSVIMWEADGREECVPNDWLVGVPMKERDLPQSIRRFEN